MKVAFFSNFLNHHQLPFCQSIMSIEGVEFKFVVWCETEEEKLNMGYEDMNNQYPFVVKAYEDEEEAFRIAKEYDVVLMGDTPVKYIEARMNANKLTFRVSERPLKKGTWRRFIPQTRKKLFEGYTKYKNDNMYLLGSSGYTASDVVLCGFKPEKCFTWGYFPPIEPKDIAALFRLKDENPVPEILYAGRLLKLKRVKDTLKAVLKLVNKGVELHFTIIGEGECQEQLAKFVAENGLEQYVTMLPFMPPNEVRKYMDRADIYVFGSDFHEGWGAVVNEAMNSACTTVVSHAVGSAPVLINDGENGFVYECGNVKQLTEILSKTISNAELRRQIGTNAYNSICGVWSAQVAAERFYSLAKCILAGGDYKLIYQMGPCSVARIYKNNWINQRK